MHHIPYEIIELILEELYHADDAVSLRSSCLASMLLCDAAQPKLFRKIIVEIYCDTNEHLTSPFASLFTLLTSSPRLAPLIHHFGFKVSSRWPGEVLYAPWIAEDEHLALLFPLFTRLKRFGVYSSITHTGQRHKIKWNDFSESAQKAIDTLLRRGDVESLDLTGFLLLSGERLRGLRGLKSVALSRVYLLPSNPNDDEGSGDNHTTLREHSPPQSQLHTLSMNFPIRQKIPDTLEWVQTAFDCSQLKELRVELPNPAGPGRMAETAIYRFIELFKRTLSTLSVGLGTIEFNRYNQLGYRISEGASVPPDWSSIVGLRSLELKVDATTKFFLYDHIDWFTNPLPFVVALMNNMTRSSSPGGFLSSNILQHFHLHIKFTNFLLRLIASNHIAWGDLFALLFSSLLFPELRYVDLTFRGLGVPERAVLEEQVRVAIAGGRASERPWRIKFTVRFVDEKDIKEVLGGLPRI